MNLQTERIGQFCKQLKLERVAAEYAAAAQSAVRDEASFTDFLETVLKAESAFAPSAPARCSPGSPASRR